ncbi:MAG: MFS transporter [Pseudomonadota bacterium]
MTARSPRRQALTVLVPGLMAYSMGQTVLFALAGPVFRDIGLRESQLGWIISAAAVVFVFSSAIWGRLSDRWGRRSTIVFGLFSYALTSFAFAFVLQLGLSGALAPAAVFGTLLTLRLLYAALGAGIQPASVALMADLSSESERASAVAMVGAAFALGMVLGPASAALLVGAGVLTPLYAIATLGLLCAGAAAWKLPAATAGQRSDDEASVPIAALWPLIVGALLIYLAMSAIQQTMAFNVQDLLGTDSVGTARQAGYFFMAIAFATIFVQVGVIQRLQPTARQLLCVGLPLGLAGIIAYALAEAFWQLLGAAVLIGLGFGMLMPGLTAAASLRVGTAVQGRVAGIMQGAMAAGFVFGPVAGTAAYELDRSYAALVALIAMIAASVILLAAIADRRVRASAPAP